jgi:DNA repair exonuclease SbcCD ATPase subunit
MAVELTQAINRQFTEEQNKTLALEKRQGEILSSLKFKESSLNDLQRVHDATTQEYNSYKEEQISLYKQVQQVFQSKMAHLEDLYDKETVRVKELQVRIDSMDETQLMIQNDRLVSSLQRANQEKEELKQKLDISTAKQNDYEIAILKYKDQIEDATQENSKLMVAGNPNAKAKHFNAVKMELNLSHQEKAKLQEQLHRKEKSEESNLKKVTQTFQDLNQLIPLILKATGGKHAPSQDPFCHSFSSIDFGLLKL